MVLVVGTGTAQIAVVVALAVWAAVFFVGKPLLVTQAAPSAMLVVTLQPQTSGSRSNTSSKRLCEGA